MTIRKFEEYRSSLDESSGHKAYAPEPDFIYSPTYSRSVKYVGGRTFNLQGSSYKVVSLYRPSYIQTLPSEEHELLRPIPVEVCRDYGNGWIAELKSARVAMSGDSIIGAVRALEYYIVDVFDLYTEMETELSVELTRQLNVLRTYVRKK